MKGELMKTQGTSLLARISVFLFICGLIVFWGFQVSGEEWTAEQKEIWKTLESSWETFKLGDVEALMAFYHEGNLEWWSSRTHPYGTDELKLRYKDWFDYDKPVSIELKPIHIRIFGDFAIVFYQVKWKGKVYSDNSRRLCAYIKENNKWKKIGSMSCSCEEPSKCQ